MTNRMAPALRGSFVLFALVGCAASPAASPVAPRTTAGTPAASPSAPATVAAPADLVLEGGRVALVAGAEAIAIRGNKIVAVGKNDAMRPFVGPQTRVVSLKGRLVLPAMTDSHVHMFELGRTLEGADLRGCASADDCARRARRPEDPSEWSLGQGWDQNRFPDKKFPSHAALDKVVPDRPVWLTRVDGHAGWANATTLRLARITRQTKDPPGGRIVRDAKGEPTGVLVDTAMELVEGILPTPSAEARERAILRAQSEVVARGITEVHEMGISAETVQSYRTLAAAGKLRVRVYALGDGAHWADQSPDPPAPFAMFSLRGIKLFSDGALGSRGAALFAPYTDDPSNTGLVLTSKESIESAAKRALAKGWQVAVHAIGDRGNRNVLDAFAAAGVKPRDRFRIEHAQVVSLEDIPRFHEMGIIASMQPTHATSDMPWAEARLGPSRIAGAYAWRRFLDANVVLAGGSDFPVEEVDLVKGGLFAAVTRTDPSSKPEGGWLPDQKMTLTEALTAFSASAAYAAFEESWRGTATVGRAADLTVVDRDFTTMPPQALLETKIDLTIVDGRVVYER